MLLTTGVLIQTREISDIDAKILKDLLKDGRKSFTEIAKECDTTKGIIWKHYREMKKAGIITGSTIQMNYASFGYYAVGSIQLNVEPQRADHAVEYILKMPNIYGAWRRGKSSAIFLVVTLKNLEELDQVKETIKKLPSVYGLITNVWTGIRNIPENLAIIPTKNAQTDRSHKSTNKTIKKTRVKLDEIDIKIVEQLAKNGRSSFRKIAENIGSSTNTVARRYEKLKRNGTVNVSIQIDPTKIGYQATAYFNIAFSAQNGISTVVETIAKIPDITLILKTSGIYDLSVKAMIKNIDQLLNVQEEITSMEGITKVETSVQRPHAIMPGPREYISTF